MKTVPLATRVLWDGWIVLIKRVNTKGTVLMKPAVSNYMFKLFSIFKKFPRNLFNIYFRNSLFCNLICFDETIIRSLKNLSACDFKPKTFLKCAKNTIKFHMRPFSQLIVTKELNIHPCDKLSVLTPPPPGDITFSGRGWGEAGLHMCEYN